MSQTNVRLEPWCTCTCILYSICTCMQTQLASILSLSSCSPKPSSWENKICVVLSDGLQHWNAIHDKVSSILKIKSSILTSMSQVSAPRRMGQAWGLPTLSRWFLLIVKGYLNKTNYSLLSQEPLECKKCMLETSNHTAHLCMWTAMELQSVR